MPSVPKSQVRSFQKQQTQNQQYFFLIHQFCEAKLAFWNPHSNLQMMYEIKYSYLHSAQGKEGGKKAFLSVLWHAISVILDIQSDTARNKILVPDTEKNTIYKIFCTFFFFSFPVCSLSTVNLDSFVF